MMSSDSTSRRPVSRIKFAQVLPYALAFLVLVGTANLGFWQLRRADFKRIVQEQVDDAIRSDPIAISSQPPAMTPLAGRMVRLRGQWQPELTVYIDNRTHQGVAGFTVVTPLQLEADGVSVLVMRGWVARDPINRKNLPAVPTEGGTVSVVGIAQTEIDKTLELMKAPVPGPADRLWQNLDFEEFSRWSGRSVLELVVRQAPSSASDDGLVRVWPVTGSDVDRHLGYAAQWFGLSALTLGLLLYFGLLKKRNAKRKQ